MMKLRVLTFAVLSGAMIAAPLAGASAHEHGFRHGHDLGLLELPAAIIAGTAAVLAAPFVALAPRPYEPRGYYYAPPPPRVYAPPPRVYRVPPPPAYYGYGYGYGYGYRR